MANRQDNQETSETKTPSKGYGKRPIWQWILLYLVIGFVVYFLIYILFFSSGDTGGSLY